MWDHFFLLPKGVRGQKTILKKAFFAIGKGQTRRLKLDAPNGRPKLDTPDALSELVRARRAPQCPLQELEGGAHRALNF